MSNVILSPVFAGTPIRVYGTSDAPLFVASDVTKILGISNGSDAVSSLDDDEKGVALTDPLSPGGQQQIRTVTESGLFALIFKSRKPEAKAFRKWVTSEVLPAIRKTGNFQSDSTTPRPSALPDLNPLFAVMKKLRQKGLSADMSAQIANDMLKSQAIQARYEGRRERRAKVASPQIKSYAKLGRPRFCDQTLYAAMLDTIGSGVTGSRQIQSRFCERVGCGRTKAYEILNELARAGKITVTPNGKSKTVTIA